MEDGLNMEEVDVSWAELQVLVFGASFIDHSACIHPHEASARLQATPKIQSCCVSSIPSPTSWSVQIGQTWEVWLGVVPKVNVTLTVPGLDFFFFNFGVSFGSKNKNDPLGWKPLQHCQAHSSTRRFKQHVPHFCKFTCCQATPGPTFPLIFSWLPPWL